MATGNGADAIDQAVQLQQQQQQQFLQQQAQHEFQQAQQRFQALQEQMQSTEARAAEQFDQAGDGTVNLQRMSAQMKNMAAVMQAMQANQAAMQQQQFFAFAAQGQATPTPAGSTGTPTAHREHKYYDLKLVSLPDPNENFDGFMRSADEFIFQHSRPDATFPGRGTRDDWDIAKALKDALPEALRSDFELTCATPEISLTRVLNFIKDNYQEDYEVRKLRLIEEFSQFQRTTSSLKTYVREFEHQMFRLRTVSHTVNDREMVLITKAMLTPEAKADVLKSMNNKVLYTNVACTYAEVKKILMTFEGNTSAFVRVNTTEQSSAQHHAQTQHVHWGETGGGKDKNNWRRGRTSDRYQPYGKGPRNDRSRTPQRDFRSRSGTPTRELCRQFQRGACRFGANCRFQHVDNRSRSREHGGKGGSPRRSGGPAPPCRQFQQGNCTYGDRCRFTHGGSPRRSPSGGRDGTPRRFAGSPANRSQSPRFGARGSPSRSPAPAQGGRNSRR